MAVKTGADDKRPHQLLRNAFDTFVVFLMKSELGSARCLGGDIARNCDRCAMRAGFFLQILSGVVGGVVESWVKWGQGSA